MNYRIVLTVLICSITIFSFSKNNLKQGSWIGKLHLTETTDLPFEIVIKKLKGDYNFFVINGKEIIHFNKIEENGDSLAVEFTGFHSTLQFVINNKNCFSGYWINHNKSGNYRIPFEAKCNKESRFNDLDKLTPSTNISGNWKVVFDYESNNPWYAVGVFDQNKKNYVEGTFLTETGDFRFLEGSIGDNKFNLSCFDGSHAFLFESNLKNDTLWGTFYSGNHYQSKYYAVKDDNYILRDSDSITHVVNEDKFAFSFPDLEGETYNYPNNKNTVTIIQIMGTWCPNCLDETRYYKSLKDKYGDKLDVIAVGYESANDFETQANKIKRLRDTYNLDFTFLVGGKASKPLASEHFNMLNKVISFPTSIYLNQQGEVVRVHTGFNGPGTGEKYTEYTKKTEALLDDLINN